MLAARNLSFSRGARPILSAIEGELRPGRVTALLGPNGAGKSTLLKLFAGELPPSSGSIELGGRPLAGQAPRKSHSGARCCRRNRSWLSHSRCGRW